MSSFKGAQIIKKSSFIEPGHKTRLDDIYTNIAFAEAWYFFTFS